METVATIYPAKSFVNEITSAPPAKIIPGRVRVVKDTLRVGKWLIGYDPAGREKYRTFTADDLRAIVARFNEHLAAGIPHPLCWGHTELGHSDTDELRSIADLAEVWTDGVSLFFSVYVMPEVRDMLQSKSRPCSPRFEWNWADGTGKTWEGISLMHVAIVTHATCPAQSPFLQLSLATKPEPKGKTMTFDVCAPLIGRLMERLGMTLPLEGDNAVTDETIDTVLPILVDSVCGPEEPAKPEDVGEVTAPAEPVEMATPAKPAAPAVPEVPADKPADAPVPTEREVLELSIKTIIGEALKPVTDRLVAIEGERASKARGEFEAEVDALCKAGMPAKNRANVLEMGAKFQWDKSCLAPLKGAKFLQMGSQIGRAASPDEPQQEQSRGFSEADREAARKARFGTAKKAA